MACNENLTLFLLETRLIVCVLLMQSVTSVQVDKVVQLYETMMTRHCTMIVGPTGGGKTVIINTLIKAQAALGMPTKVTVLNPKVRLLNILSVLTFLGHSFFCRFILIILNRSCFPFWLRHC